MQQNYFWLKMALDIYQIVSGRESCAKNSHNAKHSRYLHLFSPTGPMEIVAMDMLGPLSKTTKENQLLFIITDCYSKLTRVVLTALITMKTVAEMSFNTWVIPYAIPAFLSMENGSQLVIEIFKTMGRHLGRKHLTAAAYHSQTNDQGERYDKTVVCRYVVTYQPTNAIGSRPLNRFLTPTTRKCIIRPASHRSV